MINWLIKTWSDKHICQMLDTTHRKCEVFWGNLNSWENHWERGRVQKSVHRCYVLLPLARCAVFLLCEVVATGADSESPKRSLLPFRSRLHCQHVNVAFTYVNVTWSWRENAPFCVLQWCMVYMIFDTSNPRGKGIFFCSNWNQFADPCPRRCDGNLTIRVSPPMPTRDFHWNQQATSTFGRLGSRCSCSSAGITSSSGPTVTQTRQRSKTWGCTMDLLITNQETFLQRFAVPPDSAAGGISPNGHCKRA